MSDEEYVQIYGKTRDEMIKDTREELHEAVRSGDKARAKALSKLLKEVFVGDDVLTANEYSSNFFTVNLMIALGVILFIIAILGTNLDLGFDRMELITHVWICLGEIILGIIVFFSVQKETHWMKYFLMFILCMVVASAHTVFGYSAEMSLILPIVISTKYLSEKFSRNVCAVSFVLMLASTLLSAVCSVGVDLNTIALQPGTTITIETSLDAAVQKALETSPQVVEGTVRNLLIASFIPNFLQFFMASFVCVTIAKWGHDTVVTQDRVAREYTRMDTELSMATDIQSNMLPNIFPAFPERDEVDIYAVMDPAREVGGDFYDFFFVDDDHLGLVIADVSGKGMPAALFMMIGKTLIKNEAMNGSSPGKILARVNTQLCENNSSGLFITAWVGILELSTGRLTAASAGHEYPFLKRGAGEYEVYKDRHGFVLGGMEGSRYREYELQLAPGDRIFVYTDGATEATNAAAELFGMDRLQKALNDSASGDENGEIAGVRKAIDAFVGLAPQFDDLTMLGVTYFGPEGKK